MSLFDAVADLQSHKATFTDNGMPTHTTSLSNCLDFFYRIGSFRNSDSSEKIQAFDLALAENPSLAFKILFWARDIRGGAGERNTFRELLVHTANSTNSTYVEALSKNYDKVVLNGRWDDLFVLIKTPLKNSVVKYISSNLDNGLLCKWMPRKGDVFNLVRAYLKLTPKELRKRLVANTKVVETNLCNKDYTFDYAHVPSVASRRYSKAFLRNDKARYSAYLSSVMAGEAKMNASAIFPYDIIRGIDSNPNQAIAQWNSLPNYMEGVDRRFLPICDVSGSMYGLPLEVCVSLGLYISERNEGVFKDQIITFSKSPKMVKLKGNLVNRVHQLKSSDWGMNTNFEAVFDLLLTAAKKHKVPESQMPTDLLVLSDMQFDVADSHFDKSAVELVQQKYEDAGYEMPTLVFWNLKGSGKGVPARKNSEKIALVSGFSPSLMISLISGSDFTPTGVMLRTVDKEKYTIL
jgi:hypothetical protein